MNFYPIVDRLNVPENREYIGRSGDAEMAERSITGCIVPTIG